MASDKLTVFGNVKVSNPRLLLGFTGWMDGGEVSTGTVRCLIDKLQARKIARIAPAGFYIYSFPGSMEVSALFRPYTNIKDGLVEAYEPPRNVFFCDEKNNLILFLGREPNLRWTEFAECIFSLCARLGVQEIYFIGSVAGLVPHTREPRIFSSVSDEKLKAPLQDYGIKFTNYEGPASIVTCLTTMAGQKGLDMTNLVAEIPAYVQGRNPKCIEAVTRRLAGLLGLHVQLDDLRAIGDELEKKLTEIVQAKPELATHIQKLEEDYDNQVFDTEMGDLKNWLVQQGIRLD